MTYRGHVRNGVVVLDQPAGLLEGVPVSVRPLKHTKARRKGRKATQTVAERLAPFIGVLKGLPPDLSINHDHYLYGMARRK